MAELIDAIKTEKPDNFTPRIVKQIDDYIYVEYSSPFVGFVDDVEFWFPPGSRSVVEYRSASQREGIDFGFNRKRIKGSVSADGSFFIHTINFIDEKPAAPKGEPRDAKFLFSSAPPRFSGTVLGFFLGFLSSRGRGFKVRLRLCCGSGRGDRGSGEALGRGNFVLCRKGLVVRLRCGSGRG